MEIKGYTLENAEKIRRAAEGSPTSAGAKGGVGYEDEDALLAEYDRLGGLITVGSRKVKTGSFWNFKDGKPNKKPEVIILVRIGDQEVEVPEGEPLPIEAQAQEILAKKARGKKNVAKVSGKKGSKAVKIPEGEDQEAGE